MLSSTLMIHSAIEAQALANPDAIAIDFDNTGKTLTFGALATQAASIAQAIRTATKDSKEQPLVAINTERSLVMVSGSEQPRPAKRPRLCQHTTQCRVHPRGVGVDGWYHIRGYASRRQF